MSNYNFINWKKKPLIKCKKKKEEKLFNFSKHSSLKYNYKGISDEFYNASPISSLLARIAISHPINSPHYRSSTRERDAPLLSLSLLKLNKMRRSEAILVLILLANVRARERRSEYHKRYIYMPGGRASDSLSQRASGLIGH